MKQSITLIILSLLLLSSFLISCEKKEETLYQWKTSSGYEWKEIGDKDTQIQYRGFVDDGSPEGLGVMTSPDGRKYVGEFKDGKTMVKEHLLFMMEGCMWENLEKINLGMGKCMIKTETLLEGL